MNPKDELEQYEATEAKEVICLLKTLNPSTVESAPPSFEAKVLARLEEKQTHRRWFTVPSWYQIPVSLAAGVIIGVAMIPYFQSQEVGTLPMTTPTDFRGPDGVIKPDDNFRGLGSIKKPAYKKSPEDWLEYITNLINDRQINSANVQLEAFRKQYPDYESEFRKP